jgi:hypothetical protein
MHIPAIMNRRMIVIKFQGTYEGLQNQLAFTGIGGIWRDFGNQKQYVANTGAVLNWWRSTKTVYFQGGPSAAKEELKAAFFAVTSKEVRPCKI